MTSKAQATSMISGIVRAATRDDLPALLDIYNYYVEHTHHTADLEPTPQAEFDESFELYDVVGPHRMLVCESEGRPIGYASSREFHPRKVYARTVEVGLYIAHERRGTGIGSLLYTALLDALSNESKVHRLVAGINLPNDPSLALHSKFGFRDVATFEDIAFQDDQYWSLRWMIRSARPS